MAQTIRRDLAQPPSAHTRSRAALWRRYAGAALKYSVLVMVLLITLVPVLWIWLNSLRTGQEFSFDPLGLPTNPVWSNLTQAWEQGRFSRYYLNSIITSVPQVLGVVFLACLGGYGLWRFKFRGNKLVFYVFLLGLILPFQVIMIPLYYQLRDMRLLATYGGAIWPSIALGLPFGIFMMRAFFNGLSEELGDAALVDGCNEWQVFWHIMLPLTKPAVTTLAAFQFMWAWTSFMLPYIYLQREHLRTLPIGLMMFRDQYTTQYTLLFAGITITTVPIVVFYVLMQRKIVEGLTAGALKG